MLKAFDIKESKGRKNKEAVTDNRPYLTDFYRILDTKAFRRLNDKTQAFSLPEHSHIRNRIIHTNEVISTAIQISEGLGLNTDLCMAIAAGHDIGHVPFGHLGEKTLSKMGKKPFHHAIFSVVVAQQIEKRSRGLNLCYETLSGMLHHARGGEEIKINQALPAEFSAVMLADKIAYTFADYSDAQRVGFFPVGQFPELVEKINKHLGKETRERIANCVKALIAESKAKDQISFTEGPAFEAFNELRNVLYNHVYNKVNTHMHEIALKELYEFITTNKEFNQKYNDFDPVLFIALLTDKEVTYFGELLFSSKKMELKDIQHFGAFEILPELKDKKIDYSEPKLDW